MGQPVLVLGEVIVDFTLGGPGAESKLRFGGIVHAARGLWALGIPYSVAAVCPPYLLDSARRYLSEFSCTNFHVLGEVRGAPNVIIIRDATEVGDQGYEDLLRDEKAVELSDASRELANYRDVLIFPGKYDLSEAAAMLPADARLHLDIAYDVDSLDSLRRLKRSIGAILISTSSDLFRQLSDRPLSEFGSLFDDLAPTSVVLKENRGGARVFHDGRVEPVPALLGKTVNSVGVGDVFSAAFVGLQERGIVEAAWRAGRASSAYAQTTEPDLLWKYAQRSLRLSLDQMQALGGTTLAWERRQEHSIYLAAPDFSYGERTVLDSVIASLGYHNFRVRRPVLENGELLQDAGTDELAAMFLKDRNLISECSLVVAVPLDRDPGTLVEVGLASQLGLPIVVYDPRRECHNAMVVGSAACYSDDWDECLNAVFSALSQGDEERDG